MGTYLSFTIPLYCAGIVKTPNFVILKESRNVNLYVAHMLRTVALATIWLWYKASCTPKLY